MKRLLWYLNQIRDTKTATYRYTEVVDGIPMQKELYDGECRVIYLKPGGEALERTGSRREPTYWRSDISYTFERTNKLALDCPTVTIAIPIEMIGIADETPAAADFCLREIAQYFDERSMQYANRSRPDKENGKYYVHRPTGEVLLRNTAYFASVPAKDYRNGSGAAVYVDAFAEPPEAIRCVCIRIEIQLPYGNLKRAKKMLVDELPTATEEFVRSFNREEMMQHLELETLQNAIRKQLRAQGYCAFIANGSILAREKNSQRPMTNALPFQSPPSCEVEIAGIRGLGIKHGVTIITGGGYSGKSTVLDAVSAGIYNHAPRDGRELCITDDTAVTITAEDGRAVSALNLSPFIKWIPNADASRFSSSHASGSTSQAANIMEAVHCGSKLMLIDEDRSATNFMIQDSLMKTLIENEPITPFTERVQELAANGVSTMLVIGGSGEYLSVADTVLMMDSYEMKDVTAKAKHLAAKLTTAIPPKTCWEVNRSLMKAGFTSIPDGGSRERMEVADTGFIIIGDEQIDIRALHDVRTPAQINALAFMLRHIMCESNETGQQLQALALQLRGFANTVTQGTVDIETLVERLYERVAAEGLNVIDSGFFTQPNRVFELPRKADLFAVVYRMRGIKMTGE